MSGRCPESCLYPSIAHESERKWSAWFQILDAQIREAYVLVADSAQSHDYIASVVGAGDCKTGKSPGIGTDLVRIFGSGVHRAQQVAAVCRSARDFKLSLFNSCSHIDIRCNHS